MEPADFAARYLSKSEGFNMPGEIQQQLICESSKQFRRLPTTTALESKENSSVSLDGVPVFCTKENLERAFTILSQELNLMGFTMLQPNGSNNVNVVHLVNTAYELLQQHKHNLRLQEELETRNSKTSCDIDHLHVNQVRLKNSLTQTEKTVKVLQEKERQLLNEMKSLQQKLKNEKDEMKKMITLHQQRETQFHHDIRKRERETMKLKERLNQLLSDRAPDRRLGMEILNSLSRKDGSRGKWKTSAVENKREEEMYRTLLKEYEERHQTIIEENNILRHLLFKINSDMMETLQSVWRKLNDEQTVQSVQIPDELDIVANVDELNLMSEGHFHLPIETLHRLFRENFQLKFKFLNVFVNWICINGEKIQRPVENSDRMREEIDQDTMKQQEDLLQKEVQDDSSSYDVAADFKLAGDTGVNEEKNCEEDEVQKDLVTSVHPQL